MQTTETTLDVAAVVLLPAAQLPATVSVMMRSPPGSGTFAPHALARVPGRGWYEGSVPVGSQTFEYYVAAEAELRFPVASTIVV